MVGVKEHILIRNFFSIKEIDWDIKEFNVLTGGMAAGKSLCIKLVYFFENILHKNIFFSPIFKDTLKKENFYENLSKHFFNLFQSENQEKDFFNTEIKYTFLVNENINFDLSAKWNETAKNMEWTSNYIDAHIDIWRGFFNENDKSNVNNRIFNAINSEFLYKFPITTWFIPASRQIASVINDGCRKNIIDAFLRDFFENSRNMVSRFQNTYENSKYKQRINDILKIKNMLFIYDKQSGKYKISIESAGESKITPLELSAGQQQLLYLLLIITGSMDMTFFLGEEKDKSVFIFNNNISVLIEEPSSNLFPQEQKDTIEFIAEIFRALKNENRNARFFITTHSPYIINVINNMIKKGNMLKKFEKQPEKINKINETIGFPHIYEKDELTAIFIKKDGRYRKMIGENENVILADEIAEISFLINDDISKLEDLYNELICGGK
jgi:hypothetical protein